MRDVHFLKDLEINDIGYSHNGILISHKKNLKVLLDNPEAVVLLQSKESK